MRLGDEIEIEGDARASSRRSASPTPGSAPPDNDQLVIPNEKLVSETLRNSTIRSPRTLAEVDGARSARAPTCARCSTRSQRDATEAYLDRPRRDDATIAVRTWVPDRRLAERAESDLRLTVHDRLRELGIVAQPDAAARRATVEPTSLAQRGRTSAAAQPPRPPPPQRAGPIVAGLAARSCIAVVARRPRRGHGALGELRPRRLQPVAIGQNSFVYAADGSLLGSIPAEQNREPVHAQRA